MGSLSIVLSPHVGAIFYAPRDFGPIISAPSSTAESIILDGDRSKVLL